MGLVPDSNNDSIDSCERLRQLLLADGAIRDRTAKLTPLSGGVSSEIYLVEDGSERFVVKRALPKLKVEQEWLADVSRNAHEAAYLAYVGSFCPQSVPRLISVSAEHGYFRMEYLDASFRNWKQTMLGGEGDPRIAAEAGRLLGQIHAHSERDADARERFRTVANFEQLRIEPYLLTTARRYPALKDSLEAEAARLRASESVLAHGDFSPKNMLVNGERLVLVDCEVAWYGDAAFDLAFLFCHLFLKPLARPALRGVWREMVEAAWASYYDHSLEATVSHLLPMLMLARVDGKSPVEYLNAAQQEAVRAFARPRLTTAAPGLQALMNEWLVR
jgi:aminoglycoside phosphotransferase (APT) family kinase protein